MDQLGAFVAALTPRYDDDIVDRVHYYYTSLVLLLLAITISAKQYVGQPIQCWVPAQFTGPWEQYTENFCFVENTYWLPFKKYIPQSHNSRTSRELSYYQWVPFVLALMSLLFYMPCIIWKMFNWQSGINVQGVVKMAISADNINNETRKGAVQIIARHMEDSLELQREWGVKNKALSTTLSRLGKTKGIYLTLLYIGIKVLYLTNVIGQFFLLNAFLGPKRAFWGAEILDDLVHGIEWEASGHFPRVTMCDFDVRVLGNLHTYTVQCVLMINMFNEKIFLFIWWWFFFVAAATIANLFYWLYVFFSKDRLYFVKKYLRVSSCIKDEADDWERKAVNRFVDNLLRPDGVFTLRMISQNAGDLISTEIVECLWKNFKEKLGKIPPPYIDTKGDPTAPLLAKPETPEHGFVESFYKVPEESAKR